MILYLRSGERALSMLFGGLELVGGALSSGLSLYSK